MAISMEDVKKLRAKTSAGLALCKEALQKSDGDMEKAVEYVNDRSDVISRLYNTTGAKIGHCKLAFEEAEKDFEKAVEIINERGWNDATSADSCGGEKIEGVIGCYLHGVDQKVAALVELKCDTDFVAKNKDFKELAHELAMQVAAMKPKYVDRDSIPEDVLKKEKEILEKSDDLKGKPADIVEKILEGKMERFYEKNCLLDQVYFKDENKKVGDLVDDALTKLGEKIEVRRIYRMEMGG